MTKKDIQIKINDIWIYNKNVDTNDKLFSISEWIYETFVSKKDSENVSDWIEEWADLFPRGVKAGNKLVRSHPKDLLPKMQAFCKAYGYTKDQIFHATKSYLAERQDNDWFMTKCSTYFIHKKDEGSALAEWCDKIENGENDDVSNMSKAQGFFV